MTAVHMLTSSDVVSTRPFARTFTAKCGHQAEHTTLPLPEEGFTTSSGRVTCPGCAWTP